ncbi:MAG TPA: hypothetical protein VN317_04875 [Candidatus Methanoperedens sp.]|nr:hypothetical protein [Candidatus Methanoperedens sp.]
MPQVGRRFTAGSLGLLLLAALALGCSKHRGAPFDPDAGHPEHWVADHGESYLESAAHCTECHGADLRGGISKVSCFAADLSGVTCHPGGPDAFIHPDGWSAAGVHGPQASAAPGATSGFAYCAVCHGADFAGGAVNTPCGSCHGVPAPHPRAPWRGGASTHTRVNPGNAPACAQCHLRSGTPAAAGCFSNTLCHAQRGVHPQGWDAPGSHGAAAKRPPGSLSGFNSCTSCHGDDFRGASAGVSCFPCHGVNAPHPRSPWLARLTHTTTAQQNAGACILCHRNSNPPPGAAPGCFNNTLCHPHEPGWAGPNRHGAGAKDRPGPTRGFPACQSCHGRLFDGGVPGASCYRAGGCHTSPTPHSPGPWRGARTHVTTSQTQGGGGNVTVCALCHRRPGAPASLPDNCFNDSLCHDQR